MAYAREPHATDSGGRSEEPAVATPLRPPDTTPVRCPTCRDESVETPSPCPSGEAAAPPRFRVLGQRTDHKPEHQEASRRDGQRRLRSSADAPSQSRSWIRLPGRCAGDASNNSTTCPRRYAGNAPWRTSSGNAASRSGNNCTLPHQTQRPELASLGGRWWFQSSDKLAGVDVQSCGDFEDVVEGEVAAASFDLSDEGPVQAAAVGELFLGLAEFVSAAAHPCAELRRCR